MQLASPLARHSCSRNFVGSRGPYPWPSFQSWRSQVGIGKLRGVQGPLPLAVIPILAQPSWNRKTSWGPGAPTPGRHSNLGAAKLEQENFVGSRGPCPWPSFQSWRSQVGTGKLRGVQGPLPLAVIPILAQPSWNRKTSWGPGAPTPGRHSNLGAAKLE
jgi:hypothetical protein